MELNTHPELEPEPPARRDKSGTPAEMPDPQAVRRLPVPDWAPPLDNPDTVAPTGASPHPPAEPASATASGPGTLVTGPATRPAESGPPGGWPSQFAQVLAETLAGARPQQQLRSWTTEQTRSRIQQLGPLLSTGQQPRVRRIMTSAPSADVVEMTAVVGFGSRARVLALRLERTEDCDQRWRCTAIEAA